MIDTKGLPIWEPGGGGHPRKKGIYKTLQVPIEIEKAKSRGDLIRLLRLPNYSVFIYLQICINTKLLLNYWEPKSL